MGAKYAKRRRTGAQTTPTLPSSLVFLIDYKHISARMTCRYQHRLVASATGNSRNRYRVTYPASITERSVQSAAERDRSRIRDFRRPPDGEVHCLSIHKLLRQIRRRADIQHAQPYSLLHSPEHVTELTSIHGSYAG